MKNYYKSKPGNILPTVVDPRSPIHSTQLCLCFFPTNVNPNYLNHWGVWGILLFLSFLKRMLGNVHASAYLLSMVS